MHVGIILPGFSSDEQDWAIPVQLNLVRAMAAIEDVRVLALRYPFRREKYTIFGATVYSLGAGQVRGAGGSTERPSLTVAPLPDGRGSERGGSAQGRARQGEDRNDRTDQQHDRQCDLGNDESARHAPSRFCRRWAASPRVDVQVAPN